MRVPELHPASMTPAQRDVYDAIAATPRGQVPAPLKVWLYSPELAARAQVLGEFCRYQTSLPPRLSELAILIVAAHWRASYEWQVHEPFARSGGLSAEVIEDIRLSRPPKELKRDEQLVYDFAFSLIETRRVPEEIFGRLEEAMGATAAVELIGILGYYTLIAMTIVSTNIPALDDRPNPFPPRADHPS